MASEDMVLAGVVLQRLRQEPGATPEEIAGAVGAKVGAVRLALEALIRQGRVQRLEATGGFLAEAPSGVHADVSRVHALIDAGDYDRAWSTIRPNPAIHREAIQRLEALGQRRSYGPGVAPALRVIRAEPVYPPAPVAPGAPEAASVHHTRVIGPTVTMRQPTAAELEELRKQGKGYRINMATGQGEYYDLPTGS